MTDWGGNHGKMTSDRNFKLIFHKITLDTDRGFLFGASSSFFFFFVSIWRDLSCLAGRGTQAIVN